VGPVQPIHLVHQRESRGPDLGQGIGHLRFHDQPEEKIIQSTIKINKGVLAKKGARPLNSSPGGGSKKNPGQIRL